MHGSSEAQAGTEALEPVEGCLLWGGESNWTGCHYWMDTAAADSFVNGTEVVVEEEEGELV